MAKILGLDKYKDDIIKMYIENKTPATKIALKYNCGNTAIYDLLRKYNVSRRESRESRKTYKVDEHYFDDINTSEKAYIFGFISADGCNLPNKNAYRLSFGISSVDIDILEKIKQCLQAEQPIQLRPGKKNKISDCFSHETANLVICNKTLSLALAKKGIVQNKTFKLHFPDFIPEELISHYIRGLFDGDGGITISKRRTPYVHYIGDYVFLQELSEELNKRGFKNFLKEKPSSNPNTKIGSIHIYAQDTVKAFLDWIYKDSTIHINRKYERYYSYFYEGKPLKKYDDDERYHYNRYIDPKKSHKENNLKEEST